MNTSNSSSELLEVLADNWEMMNESNLNGGLQGSREPPVFLIIEPLLMAYQVFWIVKSVRKCWGNMEPGHIFLISILIHNFLTILASFLTHTTMRDWLTENSKFCEILYALFVIISSLRIVSSIAPEIDRVLALYWNLLYKDRVTNKRALVSLAVLYIIVILPNLMYFGFISQPSCPSKQLLLLNVEGQIPFKIPLESLYFVVTIFSCSYVFHIFKKHQNAVVPINLNPLQNKENQETQESHLLKITKIGMKVNKISISQFSSTLSIFLAQVFMLCITENMSEYYVSVLIIGYVVSFLNILILLVNPYWIYKKLSLIS